MECRISAQALDRRCMAIKGLCVCTAGFRGFQLVVASSASFIWRADWDEQIDNPNYERGQYGAEQRYGYASDDKLSDPDDGCAGDKADDTASERCNSFAKDAFNDPAERSDDKSEEECAPKPANAKLRNDEPDKHKH